MTTSQDIILNALQSVVWRRQKPGLKLAQDKIAQNVGILRIYVGLTVVLQIRYDFQVNVVGLALYTGDQDLSYGSHTPLARIKVPYTASEAIQNFIDELNKQVSKL